MGAAQQRNSKGPITAINVTPTQGKLLHILVKMQRAKNVLEIGTLGGYSTIWMARALPENGRLTTIEYQKRHADVAAKNIDRAGLSDKVEIINAPAIEALPALTDKAPFDLVFIDVDKGEHRRLLRLGHEALTPRHRDHRRQRRAQGRSDPRRSRGQEGPGHPPL